MIKNKIMCKITIDTNLEAVELLRNIMNVASHSIQFNSSPVDIKQDLQKIIEECPDLFKQVQHDLCTITKNYNS